MSDFFQNGVIANLHNLTDRKIEDLEAELIRFSKTTPMSLVLPSLYSELEQPALEEIVQELKKVPYLSEIVVGLDRANEDQFNHAKEYFGRLPQHVRILWNDGPRLKAIDEKLAEFNLSPEEMGKGRNVWYCFGYILSSGKGRSVALHDCDIKTYDRSMLAKLIYPVVNPAFRYQFCKGYYSRIAEGKLNGRACRLLVSPLIRALKTVCRDQESLEFLEYLDSFRYALSGEFSMKTEVLRNIRIPSDWGLEIGVLSELHRSYNTRSLCQADIADIYDHKHQPLSEEDAAKGLSKMSTDITLAIFRKLATKGQVFSEEAIRSIKATYYRTALDYIEMYYNDAFINGLTVDRHAEEKAVELFGSNIMKAGEQFLANPMSTPFMPSWNRVTAAMPTIFEDIFTAVEADNA